jgi:muramoyltetrapeptide carboxypeptidase
LFDVSSKKVGLFNPSFRTEDKTRLTKFIHELKEYGYDVVEMPSLEASEGYLAGSDENRAKELMSLYQNKEVSSILCFKGGYGASRIVDLLDYDIIKKNPKILAGYSDVTVLLNSIYEKSGQITFHSEMGISLERSDMDQASKLLFFHMLEGSFPSVLKNISKPAQTVVDGRTQGILIGGNLSLVTQMINTPYFPDVTGKILFLEDVDEEPYSLDRMFCQLKLLGVFEKVKGIILGYFTDCEPSSTRKNTQTVDDIIQTYFGKLTCPVLKDFECGHHHPFVPLPIGASVRLDATQQTVTVLESLFTTNFHK